ncbi:MAG: type II toxin-antitoxin system HipA family toxin, partial [Planctomycetes bacterium]|nr:type II toxin-antitoxin system HipA family toxin [Planctomycetota bacterium]
MTGVVAEVRLWGRRIGAVALPQNTAYAAFEYEPVFAQSGIEVAPLMMPLSDRIYQFADLALTSFHGLPGLLADSLPDRFGNRLIDAWLARQGREPASMNIIERLCYVGRRGMGALEFEPAQGPTKTDGTRLDIAALVELASKVLAERTAFSTSIEDDDLLRDILRIGTSAGGARAKAILAWNRVTGEVRSGQADVGAGFEHWLLKFDGVTGNRDKELADPQGFGAIEYAYYLMATAAGIEMTECRLLEENGRRHFMTRRFDRVDSRDRSTKLHMQSLGALAHYDFNQAGAYGYEQAIQVMRRLALPMHQIEELFRRMTFNIVARNHDDHVKNIAFLMNREGAWRLSPAFDVTYSFNPDGTWTSQHQMTMNGKRDHFDRSDFETCGRNAGLARGRARAILDEVLAVVARWPEFAER